MRAFPSDLYERCRLSRSGANALCESGPSVPEERQLQLIWRHQRIRRASLRLTDGTALTVLHPGFWNRGAGPDFSRCLLRIGPRPAVTGDVEIDLEPGGWTAHAHDRNPLYAGVRLHVVWRGQPRAGGGLPTLELWDQLDAPWGELDAWMTGEPGFPAGLAGDCNAPLRGLPPDGLRELLCQAGRVRLRRKALELRACARETGWNQALLEALCGGLGYSRNVWPMRRLAALGSVQEPVETGIAGCQLALEARLLGVAGFLPHDVSRLHAPARRHARLLWDLWWRDQDRWLEQAFPAGFWRLEGLRPANHPQRRIALAAHWLCRADLPTVLEDWLHLDLPPAHWRARFLHNLEPDPGGFWSQHWTFQSSRSSRPLPLLGATRAADLVVNAVLPWFWARATSGANDALCARIEKAYELWPATQDNAVLRLARQRMFGSLHAPIPLTACLQQGLLQVVADFCDRSNAACEQCEFPRLVRTWQA